MATTTKTATPAGIPLATLRRVLDEGHGPDAWYGSDISAAVSGVDARSAFRRPAKGRHNIAEIALHHAYWLHEVRRRVTGQAEDGFLIDGEDWFELPDESAATWQKVRATLAAEQERLNAAVDGIAGGAQPSPLAEAERFDQVLGVAAHAAYHAGQIQLVKKLIGFGETEK